MGVYNDQGVWQENSEDVEEVFVNYFSKFFTTSLTEASNITDAISSIHVSVSQGMVDYLDSPYSEEEVKTALFQMFPTKSPEPDRFPTLFYQHL